MDQRFRRGFTAAEKTELWDRWQRGESLKAIGRAFGKPSSSSNTFTVVFMPAPLPTTISAFWSSSVLSNGPFVSGVLPMSAAATTAPPINDDWEREEIPVGMRRIERGHPADKHIPEHLHLGRPEAGNRDDVVQPVAVDVGDRHLDAAVELRTVRLERRQQNAILGVHANFRNNAPSRSRNDLVDAIAGEIAGGDPNAALEGVPVRCELRQHSPALLVDHLDELRRARTLAHPDDDHTPVSGLRLIEKVAPPNSTGLASVARFSQAIEPSRLWKSDSSVSPGWLLP